MPEEAIYADDADFITIHDEKKEKISKITSEILKKDNLLVNDTKTEFTTLLRSEKINEKWRTTKKLGSLLGDSEDIMRRKQLSIVTQKDLQNVWIRKDKIKQKTRLKLYKTLVKPVLLYNAGTWGITKTEEKNFDAFHRKQLRIVLGVKYPVIMKNNTVYELSEETPISQQIRLARWRLFGHCLRLNKDTPAYKAMKFYFQPSEEKGFRGRKRTTLPVKLDEDIKVTLKCIDTKQKYGVTTLNKTEDLRNFEIIANDRKMWISLIEDICNAAEAELNL